MNLKQFVLKVWKLRDAVPNQDHDDFFDTFIVKSKGPLSSWTNYYNLWLAAGQPPLKEWDQKEIRFINR